jgi:hypothetical protein
MLVNSRNGMDVMPSREVLSGIKFRSIQPVATGTYVIVVYAATQYSKELSVLLEKPPVAQLLKNFPTLNET